MLCKHTRKQKRPEENSGLFKRLFKKFNRHLLHLISPEHGHIRRDGI
jgi:hypothetical protein